LEIPNPCFSGTSLGSMRQVLSLSRRLGRRQAFSPPRDLLRSGAYLASKFATHRIERNIRVNHPQVRSVPPQTVVRRGSPDPAVGATEGLPSAGWGWQGPETLPKRMETLPQGVISSGHYRVVARSPDRATGPTEGLPSAGWGWQGPETLPKRMETLPQGVISSGHYFSNVPLSGGNEPWAVCRPTKVGPTVQDAGLVYLFNPRTPTTKSEITM